MLIYGDYENSPISLELAKAHLRVDISDDDELIGKIYLPGAIVAAENYTARKLAVRNYTYTINALVGQIALPIDDECIVSKITYNNTSGAATVLPAVDYFVTRNIISSSSDWPATDETRDNVKIEFRSGVTDGEDLNINPMPEPVFNAILLILGHLYENRQAVRPGGSATLPMGAEYLLQPYRRGLGL